jgi:hypothetical protein
MPALPAAGCMAAMEQTATQEQQQGRFARSSAQPHPAPEAALSSVAAPAPPADLAAVRAIQRRWPRTVPAKRVFPRG